MFNCLLHICTWNSSQTKYLWSWSCDVLLTLSTWNPAPVGGNSTLLVARAQTQESSLFQSFISVLIWLISKYCYSIFTIYPKWDTAPSLLPWTKVLPSLAWNNCNDYPDMLSIVLVCFLHTRQNERFKLPDIANLLPYTPCRLSLLGKSQNLYNSLCNPLWSDIAWHPSLHFLYLTHTSLPVLFLEYTYHAWGPGPKLQRKMYMMKN